jgi:hypothetical protein
MLKSLQIFQKASNRWLPTLFFGMLLASTVLLSACNGLPITNASAHSQQATSTPAVTPSPTVSPLLQKQGSMQLQTFQQWIALMQQYGGKIDPYHQQYLGDQQALTSANTDPAYQTALNTLNGHVDAIKLPALQIEALSLQQQLSQEASAWSSQHTYYDSYNGVTYNLGYEYQAVVNYPAQGLIDGSETIADYQYVIGQLNAWLANFEAYKANFSDKTPYNQVHQTDTQLIQKYGYTSGQVLVISLSEQAMRVYQDGKLVKAFQVVTGMPGHPSLPGTWWIETRQTNITFTSGKQPGQDGYYPPTPIAYAMQYHSGGYYIHQSWWRSQYGSGNQFPHVDPNGTSFAYEGSHGCVNMSTNDVTWVYNFVQVDSTKIIIY